jgi:hypothetical protein
MPFHNNERTEEFSVNVLGLIKCKVTNPGKKTLLLIVVILIFTITLVLLLKFDSAL